MVFHVSAFSIPNGWPHSMSGADEARIRRAIRQIINSSRASDGRAEVECVFDLLDYLSPAAQVIVNDEVACTLAELVGNE